MKELLTSNLRVIEPFRSKDGVRAEVYKSKLGGKPVVVIEADTGTGDDAEVVLNAQEAHDLMLWLQCALSAEPSSVETSAHQHLRDLGSPLPTPIEMAMRFGSWFDRKDLPLPEREREVALLHTAFVYEKIRAAVSERSPEEPSARRAIDLTPAEIQSNFDRVKWAEALIRQLPETHDGRNSWLLNHGQKAC